MKDRRFVRLHPFPRVYGSAWLSGDIKRRPIACSERFIFAKFRDVLLDDIALKRMDTLGLDSIEQTFDVNRGAGGSEQGHRHAKLDGHHIVRRPGVRVRLPHPCAA